MPTNVCVPFFKPGQDITGQLAANLSGKTFVAVVAGGRGSQPHIGLPAAAGRPVLGVLGHDGVTGQYIHVNVGGVVPVVVGATAVATGTEVMTDAAGRAVPHDPAVAANRAVGYAVAGAASGNAAAIKLYG